MKIRDLPVNIHIRLWGSFFNRIASSAILPFMALYLSDEISKSFAGIFLASIVIFTFFINILAGYICDRVPRKKMLIITSYLESSMLFAIMIAVWKGHIYFFLIFYILYVIASTFRRPSLTALVQDSVNEQNKNLVYRMDYWLINLSIALGVSVGGILYSSNKILLFILFAVTSLTLAVIYSLFIRETREFVNQKVYTNVLKDLFFSYKEVFKNKRYLLVLIGWTFIFSAELSVSGYIAVRLANNFNSVELFNIDINGVRMFSLISILNTAIVVICTFWIGKIVNRYSVKKILITGLIPYTIGYTLLTSANTVWLIVISVLLATLGEIIYSPVLNSEELKLIPKNKRGTYATASSFKFIGGDLIAKLGITMGAFLSPISMTIVMAVVVGTGSLLVIYSFFYYDTLSN